MKDRIKELRITLGKSQGEFAEELHLATNYISLIETGKNAVSDKFIFRVCERFNVNELWIRTGEGAMFNPKDRADEIADIALKLAKENKPNTEKLIRIVANLSEEQVQHIFELAKILNEENQR